MNDDFEARLESLVRRLPRAEPTAAWKEEILARARWRNRERRPPRWLTLPLAACWVAIAVLNLGRPEVRFPPEGNRSAGAAPSPAPVPALFALHHQLRFELDLP